MRLESGFSFILIPKKIIPLLLVYNYQLNLHPSFSNIYYHTMGFISRHKSIYAIALRAIQFLSLSYNPKYLSLLNKQ